MPSKKGIWDILADNSFSIMVGLALLFLLVLLFFHKQINTYLKDREEFKLFSLSPVSRKAGGITKKHERRCREIFETLLGRPFPSARPQFMKRSNGYCLELDGLNRELKLAFEYNGSQHVKFNPKFHRSMKDFTDQLQRDLDKAELCRRAGITLVNIPHTIKYQDLEKYIRAQLSTLGYI